MNERRYERTMYACFIGYIVQAIVNNFVTLLFLTFEKSYHIPLGKITMLITINFGIQLLVDLLSAGFVDKLDIKCQLFLPMCLQRQVCLVWCSCRNFYRMHLAAC